MAKHQINGQGISSLSNTQLEEIITEIEQAFEWHESWYKNLLRCLISDVEADLKDLHSDAHNLCKFGQWFNKLPSTYLALHPQFSNVGEAHKKMHEGAKVLLSLNINKSSIPVSLFDSFHQDLEYLREILEIILDAFTEHLNTRDPLTGATDRTNLLHDLQSEHALCKRKSLHCAIIMLDLDHFKQVNDNYGHSAGDKVLIALVDCIKSHLRQYDHLYRYGGEEFLVYLPQTDATGAQAFAERLREAIEQLKIEVEDTTVLRVTGSFGVTVLTEQDDIEMAIERADEAMYKAKEAGRNRVHCD